MTDWIERIFGVSPDGGSGAFEAMLIGFALVAFLVVRPLRRRVWLAAGACLHGLARLLEPR